VWLADLRPSRWQRYPIATVMDLSFRLVIYTHAGTCPYGSGTNEALRWSCDLDRISMSSTGPIPTLRGRDRRTCEVEPKLTSVTELTNHKLVMFSELDPKKYASRPRLQDPDHHHLGISFLTSNQTSRTTAFDRLCKAWDGPFLYSCPETLAIMLG
jgi:hypothetical protein